MSILPCERCGQCGCECDKSLPYTITAAFSGLQDKTHSPHCALTFTSNFGSGASAVVTAPGGDNKGPIESILVTNGGCGYARLGHVEPTLKISGGSGTGAAFTPTLEATGDAYCQEWHIKSIEMKGGSGYLLDDYLTIKAGDGVIERVTAVAKLAFGRKEPDVKASATGGSGAELTVSLEKTSAIPRTWSVDSVEVDDGGSGYEWGSAVSFTTAKTEVTAAEAKVETKLSEPTLSASVVSYSGGAGAVLGTPSLYKFTPPEWWYGYTGPSEVWGISSIPVISGGTKYIRGADVQITVVDGVEARESWVRVSSTDDSGGDGIGAVVAVEPYPGYQGGYYKDSGVIESISVTNAGEYYGESGTPGDVDVIDGGIYYSESKKAPACVADIEVTAVSCGNPYQPLSAVVDSDVESETFGQITEITVDGPGVQNSTFQGWSWQQTKNTTLNGAPIVLVANSPKKLVTVSLKSCFGDGAQATVNAVGERDEPDITLVAGCAESLGPCDQCNGGSIEATLLHGTDSDGKDFWTIESVAASGGVNYADSSQAAIVTVGKPCLVVNEPPQITVTATNGAITAATVQNGGKFWNQLKYDGLPGPLRDIGVCDSGSGYARLGREEPFITIEPSANSLGSNATFTPSFSEHQDDCKVDYWKIYSVTVSGGQHFKSGDSLSVSLATESDYEDDPALLTVQVNDEGVPTGVTIVKPGAYYRENKSLPPYVADVTVTVEQASPSDGSGAELTAVIDEDTESENFGKVLSIKIDSAGSNYQILGGPMDCTYTDKQCRDDNNYEVTLQFRGKGKKPRVSLLPGAVFETDDALEDCDNLPSSAPLLYGAESGSVTLAAGGAVATDCEPEGYCASPPQCGLRTPAYGCPTVQATGTVTVPDGQCAGTYEFDFNVPFRDAYGGQCLDIGTGLIPCWYQGSSVLDIPGYQGAAFADLYCGAGGWTAVLVLQTNCAFTPSLVSSAACVQKIEIEFIDGVSRPRAGVHVLGDRCDILPNTPDQSGLFSATLTITYP